MTANQPATHSRRKNGRSPLQRASLAQTWSSVRNGESNETTSRLKIGCRTYSNSIRRLQITNKCLKIKNKLLAAKAHNRLKMARRARMVAKEQTMECNRLLQNVQTTTKILQNQASTQEVTNRQFHVELDRTKNSQSFWRKRARAADEACRYMQAKCLTHKRTPATKLYGAYSQQIRSLCRQLVMSGVAAVQVPKVIRMCTRAFGIEPGPLPHPRSVGQFIIEGGVAAKIQVGNVLAAAEGITTSMDSTSHCDINFSSMHVMANSPGLHNQLYLAVESTPDHTSKTQVNTLKSTFDSICNTTRHAPKCKLGPEVVPCTSDIACKLYGVNGDHASDQLKVAQLEKEWKIDSWIAHLGNTKLALLGDSESRSFYESLYAAAVTEAGGVDAFSGLHIANQEDLIASEYQKHVWALGKTEFDISEPNLKENMSLVVCGGCCAHKDMNATKGGTSAMAAFWRANTHLSPPVKLFNKDNDATMSLSDPSGELSEAEQRALSVTGSGAVKLLSLAGDTFNHKDDKKGHQDSHPYYFAEKFGQYHRFPDTSNTCYSSFIDAATELCMLLNAYIDYMEHIRRQKATGQLNHLESNIVLALNCLATLAELLCMSLYGQIISKPYIQLVRGATTLGKGLANLVLLHIRVQSLLQTIIATPSRILSLNSPDPSVTLNGSEWENPGVVEALKEHQVKLPYLSDLFVAFCQGASTTWARFTDDIAPSSPINSLTSQQHEKAFMPPTNNANKGALGTWRVWARQFPSLALHKFNAIFMNQANETEAYIEKNFTLKQHNWIRAEARQIDSSRPEHTQKTEIVTAQTEIAAKNEEARLQRAGRQSKCDEYIAGIKLILDPAVIQTMVGKELDDQLKVYKKNVVLSSGKTFPAISKLKVAEKRSLVIGLAQRYVQEMQPNEGSSSAPKV